MHVEAFNTIYAIYYRTDTKILVRIVIPHFDEHLFDGTHCCGPGESVVYASAGNNDEFPEWENHVFNATGIVPLSPLFNVEDDLALAA